MLFADTPLVRRIESAGTDLLVEIARATRARDPGRDMFVSEFSGGAATYLAPHSPFNRLVGIGLSGRLDLVALAEVETEFRARQIALQAEVCSHADARSLGVLTRRGFRVTRFDHVYGRRVAKNVDADVRYAHIAVHPVDENPESRTEWIENASAGFSHSDDPGTVPGSVDERENLARALADTVGCTGLHDFVACMDARIAGTASVHLGSDGIAQLCGAATLPAFRRRGVQAALVIERLNWAASRGCDIATVATGPGTQSAKNLQALGFEMLYARAIMMLDHGP